MKKFLTAIILIGVMSGISFGAVSEDSKLDQILNAVVELRTEVKELREMFVKLDKDLSILSERENNHHAELSKRIDETNNVLSKRIDDTNSVLSKQIDDTNKVLSKRIDDTNSLLSKKIDDTNNVLSKQIDDTNNVLSKRIDDTNTALVQRIDGVGASLSSKIADGQAHTDHYTYLWLVLFGVVVVMPTIQKWLENRHAAKQNLYDTEAIERIAERVFEAKFSSISRV